MLKTSDFDDERKKRIFREGDQEKLGIDLHAAFFLILSNASTLLPISHSSPK